MADKHETARSIAIACDHGGFALKEVLKSALSDVTWLDLGTDSAVSVDYPIWPTSWPMPSGTAKRGAAY